MDSEYLVMPSTCPRGSQRGEIHAGLSLPSRTQCGQTLRKPRGKLQAARGGRETWAVGSEPKQDTEDPRSDSSLYLERDSASALPGSVARSGPGPKRTCARPVTSSRD